MPRCSSCATWQPSRLHGCPVCGGRLEPVVAPPRAPVPVPAISPDEQRRRATLIASYIERRAVHLGVRGRGPSIASPRALAASLQLGEHDTVEVLWQAFGRDDAWWPDWEAEEELDAAMLEGSGPDTLLATVVAAAERSRAPSPADMVARWLKVEARLQEQRARRGGDTARDDPPPVAMARRLRDLADRARSPDGAPASARIVAASHSGAEFVATAALKDAVRQEVAAVPFAPESVLERLADAAEANPFTGDYESGGTTDNLLTAGAWLAVGGLVGAVEAVDTVGRALGRSKTR